MFFYGFLIGLVAGVWLAAIYVVTTIHGQTIRSYFNRLGRSTALALQPVEASSQSPAPYAQTTMDRPTPPVQNIDLRRTARLDPTRLSQGGAESYQYLILLVHDEPTARRLVEYEARQQPDADIEDMIDRAVDRVIHDRI